MTLCAPGVTVSSPVAWLIVIHNRETKPTVCYVCCHQAYCTLPKVIASEVVSVTMGRFRFDDQDCDTASPTMMDTTRRDIAWEFTAERGDEGSIVVRRQRRGRTAELPTITTSEEDEEEEEGEEDDETNAWDENRIRDGSNSFGTIYFTANEPDHEHDEDDDAMTWYSHRRGLSWWALGKNVLPLTILMLAFAAWLIREGPPGPPLIQNGQQYLTWTDFLATHSQQWLNSSHALFLAVPAHMVKWWAIHVKQDFTDIVQHYIYRTPRLVTKRCAPKSIINKDLSRLVVGQKRAMQTVVDALFAWQQDPSRQQDSRPLLLYLAGFSDTGRATLASRLHELLYTTDDIEEQPITCVLPKLLRLNGEDFASMSAKPALIRKLYNSNENVLIESVENMDPSLLVWLVQHLGSSDDDGDDEIPDREEEHELVSLRQHCRSRIFFFTSTVGSRSIGTGIRLERNPSTLLLDVVHEINTYYSVSNMAEHFDAVAPFWPLTQDDLKDILRNQVELYSEEQRQLWKSLVLTDSSLDYFLSPEMVEYFSLDGRERSIMTFASTGTKSLAEKSVPWNKIRAVITRCQLELHANQVAVMNVIVSRGEVTLSWCENEALIASPCEEACRLPLL